MPFYDHECPDCGHRQEAYYKFSDYDKGVKIPCEKCGKLTQCLLPEKVHVVFKGGGFAIKDQQHDKQLQEAERAMSEPLTATEANELPDIAAEEEKKRGLDPGTILGREKPIHSSRDEQGNITLDQKALKKKRDVQRKEVEKFMSAKSVDTKKKSRKK
jgi:putative FmdB family regulatory protein